MKLTRLQVYNHKRYKLNPAMMKFDYVIDKPIQVLLGTNGAGKSTTNNLVFPWPEAHQVLGKDGYVKQSYTHRDHNYQLELIKTGNKAHYNFIRDDVELNESHLFSVQCELVERYFLINKDLQKVLNDKKGLCDMSPMDIKHWLTTLSSTDYDYVLGVYKKIKARKTYLRNILTHINKQKISEEDNEFNQDIEELESALEKQFSRLKTLRGYKKYHDDTLTYTKLDMDRIRAIRAKHLKLLESEPRKDMSKLNDELEALKASMIKNTERYDILSSALSDTQRTMDGFADQDMINQLTHKAEQLSSVIRSEEPLTPDDVQELQLSLERLVLQLRDIIEDIPAEGFSHTNEEFQEKKSLYMRLRKMIEEQAATLQQKERDIHTLEALKANGQHTCPKCQHSFYTKYNRSAHKKLLSEVDKLTSDLDMMRSKLTELEETLTIWSKALKALESLFGVYQNTYNLKQYVWNDINQIIRTNPAEVDNIINNFKDKLRIMEQDAKYRKELNEINEQLAIYKSVDDKQQAAVIAKSKTIENQLNEVIIALRTDKARAEKLDKILTLDSQYRQMKEEYLSTLAQNKIFYANRIEAAIQEALDIDINDCMNRIELIKKSIADYNAREATIAKLDAEIAGIREEQVQLDILDKQMSPDSGLIGQTLEAFTGMVIDSINIYLNKVWAHSLELLPPTIKNGRMQYTFSCKVADNIVPDIRECSSGEQNMINLAFKLVLMQLYDISDYPLILDEFGVGLDHVHKDKAYKIVSEEFIHYGFSNIFLTSHFSEFFKIYADNLVDYIVIDGTNADLTEINISPNMRRIPND